MPETGSIGADSDATAWPAAIHAALTAHGVRQVAYVPDAGRRTLIELCRADPAMTAVPLTTEEEGVALLAGAWLGGERGALLMQSSGLGNCINMLSLTKVCRFPLLMLLTMRGEWAEANPWQVPMGQITEDLLRTTDVLRFRAEQATEVGAVVDAAARMAFEGSAAAAVVIAQRLIGAKTFDG